MKKKCLFNIQAILDLLDSSGIYALLDAHQDVLWKEPTRNGTYWGVPPWIKEKLRDSTIRQYPWPFQTVNNWVCGYFTQEISHAFESFYENVNGTADDFANFWTIVAKSVKNRNNVVGYELLNEPFAGDLFKDRLKLLPGVAGHENLQPFYDRIQAAIRTVDTEKIIFWEPVQKTELYFKPRRDKFFSKLGHLGVLFANSQNFQLNFQGGVEVYFGALFELLFERSLWPNADFIRKISCPSSR